MREVQAEGGSAHIVESQCPTCGLPQDTQYITYYTRPWSAVQVFSQKEKQQNHCIPERLAGVGTLNPNFLLCLRMHVTKPIDSRDSYLPRNLKENCISHRCPILTQGMLSSQPLYNKPWPGTSLLGLAVESSVTSRNWLGS